MRTLLIGGNPGRWRASDADAPFRGTNGIEAFVYALDGDYRGDVPRRDEIAPYECVIANLNPWHRSALAALAENRPPNTKFIALIEGAGEDYFEPDDALDRILWASDLVAVINRRTLPLYEAMTSTHVVWTGIPYPVEAIERHRVAPERRRAEVLVCPRSMRMPSVWVARQLPELTPRLYVPKVSRKLANVPIFACANDWSREVFVHQWVARLPGAVVCFERELPEFFAEAAGCRLWINLDPRHTWARFVLDAAALGVPLVTTASTDHGPELWPETTVSSPFEISQAVAIARRLLEDPDFAERVCSRARAGLEFYSPSACVSRLKSALE